jgi:hypothetical protein
MTFVLKNKYESDFVKIFKHPQVKLLDKYY